jgi:ribosome-binding ATPase YchF (GTP1/OBG family)
MLVGIVGCPNSGKSTFLKALTLTDVEIAGYPFTTIKPNQGVGFVRSECPCRKLGVKCSPQNSRCEDGVRFVPVKLLDVAGLVPGAHEGRGLGNQFLGDLIQASGLIHVLDSSGKTNAEGKPEEGYDPAKTIGVLEYEIDEWMRGIVKKANEKCGKLSETQKIPIGKLLAKQLSGLGITESDIKLALRKAGPGEHEFASVLRKVSKPVLIAANKIDLPESRKNFERINRGAVPCSAESELALREAERHGMIRYVPGSGGFEVVPGKPSDKQKRALDFIKRNVLDRYESTGVHECLNRLVFGMLEQVVVYPVASISRLSDTRGNVLPDAFLVRKGTTLREFAEKIHTDLAESFIGGLNLDKKKIGADYELRDGDVVEILFRK